MNRRFWGRLLPAVSGGFFILVATTGCRTAAGPQEVQESALDVDSQETLSEDQWMSLCQKALEDAQRTGNREVVIEMQQIAQTTDCRKAYPAVKKIYTDAYKVIHKK